MTTPPTKPEDDSEALYWLMVARRILSGDIEPQDARRLLNGTAAKARRTTQPLHPSL